MLNSQPEVIHIARDGGTGIDELPRLIEHRDIHKQSVATHQLILPIVSHTTSLPAISTPTPWRIQWSTFPGAALAAASRVLASSNSRPDMLRAEPVFRARRQCARDIEPMEHELIAERDIDVVGVEHGMAAHLQHALAGRPPYVHIDCDVLEPGTVPTDYRVAAGLTLAQLTACAHAIARSEVVGLEIGELETDDAPSSDSRRDAQSIMHALEALMLAMERSTALVPLGGGPGTAGEAQRR
ncbi:arginase family protein [Plantibacter sp. CFBP 8775]|uniref:arginase family protein n=1 Tax=Plantibacter sp. CFBP 8775 TaxID=2774038 RepID=UPI0018E07AD7|nr:arginase family protein [Plantibacter sp. CFBP 8775]